MYEKKIEDLGDRWHLTIDLGPGRTFEAWIPKTCDVVDMTNFGEHLMTLAKRLAAEGRSS